MVFSLEWGLVLRCDKKKVVVFFVLTLEVQLSQCHVVAEFIVYLGHIKLRRIVPFLSQKTINITLPSRS